MSPGGSAAGWSLSSLLHSLRDVPGIAGSFVVSDLGRLLGRDMPAVFGDDVLGEVGPRALRLRETLGHESDTGGSFVVTYADYLLFLRPLRDGLMCVLGSPEVNLAALRMALTLTVRRINALLESGAALEGIEPQAVSRTQEIVIEGTGTGSGINPTPGGGSGKTAPVLIYRGAMVGGDGDQS